MTDQDDRYPSEFVPIELLQQPVKFPVATNLIAKNKLMKAPMTELLATFDQSDALKSGLPNDELFSVYRRWNDGGAGVIVTGCISIIHTDLEAVGNMVIAQEIETDERRVQFKKLASIARNGSLLVAQIIHPGRRAVIVFDDHKAKDMNDVSASYLADVVTRHVYAARFLKQCGFHGVEINVSLDFALGQLVCASTNSRHGSLMARTRIVFDIIEIIRKKLCDDGNFIVGLKMSSPNFEPNFDEQEFARFCRRLEEVGLDYITLSGGKYSSIKNVESYERESTRNREVFFARFATAVRMNIKNVPTYMCGGFHSVDKMWEALYEGWCDGIAMARPLAAEPDLCRRILIEEVRAAKRTIIDRSDYLTAKHAAGTQIWQMACRKPLLDLSDAEQVTAFREALAMHRADIQKPHTYGYTKFEVN